MNPKISDFGLARIFAVQQTEANTKKNVGTYGYMSLEYAMKGIVSMKSDVFSFGVLLLEIVSGKRNHSCYPTKHPFNLGWELWMEKRVLEVMDSRLDVSSSKDNIVRCINVGLLCIQDQANDRPSMIDVVSMLTNDSVHEPVPKQQAFFIESGAREGECETSLAPNCTNTVWVANRNNPIADASGSLLIDTDGKLKVNSREASVFNSVPVTIINASATLLDNGNFVLRELNPDGSVNQTVWQGFDYPTDTILPGIRMGINFKIGNQLIIWYEGNVYGTTGIWGNERFANLAKLLDGDFTFISNENEKYLTYSVNENISFLYYKIDPSGIVMGIVLESFGVYSFLNLDEGCVKKTLPDCRAWLLDKCEQNCSCNAYASHTTQYGTGCEIWKETNFYASGYADREIFLLKRDADSCKVLNEIAEDPYVYQNASLKKFPVGHLWPPSKEEKTFLNKYWEYGNPELPYRREVLGYFGRNQLYLASEYLKKAVKSCYRYHLTVE
ncbi:G-type lectin S-receptor-like serine threonine-kinase CES101 [Olea europaea subsp. europaea]|uniref:G-type lectin S-receptor-like serine threonine-kinase CES101 n=1 Tax=Olea europaea subsp. europaea TaxID=158383 RepID=A0A8S0QIB6_OLEEU|nr:G-type lectin S-receptor-like serine threonine-kinase CES101 [Olea europaea subsp. europaea]